MFDRILMLDWSAAKGRRQGPDSIWLGDGQGVLMNIPTRVLAETELARALSAPGRVLLGVDIGFGWPQGLSRAVTGQASALAMWDWLDAQVSEDAAGGSNYRQAAALANVAFAPASGPFWGDGTRAGTPGLSRLKPVLPPGLAALRQTEIAAARSGPAPKSMFQLAGAGAVGAQALTCVPLLARLRRGFGTGLAVWPLDPPDRVRQARIVLAEVYFSMLGPVGAGYACRDAAQVDLMARVTRRLGAEGLMRAPAPPAILTEEGWIFGCDDAPRLKALARSEQAKI
jgi:hypothetical protein